MLIIVDQKIPKKAKTALANLGSIVELSTKEITYEAISGHPDIFFSKLGDQLVIAPNLPKKYIKLLDDNKLSYLVGEEAVGEKYPASSKYNVVYNEHYLIHNFRNTDSVITSYAEDLDLIHVDQGYTRCNLLSIGNGSYISSDKGISKVLIRYKLECFTVDPSNIDLDGFKHGFFGGCCGLKDDKLYVLGSLNHLNEADELRFFLKSKRIEVVELYEGPLFDGGSILFL